jgi:hypothetical protein
VSDALVRGGGAASQLLRAIARGAHGVIPRDLVPRSGGDRSGGGGAA